MNLCTKLSIFRSKVLFLEASKFFYQSFEETQAGAQDGGDILISDSGE